MVDDVKKIWGSKREDFGVVEGGERLGNLEVAEGRSH